MTLNKYNEVMENVKVTEDMKKRILENLEKTDMDGVIAKGMDADANNIKKKNVIVPFIRRYGAIAAMLAVAIVGSYAFFAVHNSSNNMMSATSTADFAEAPAAAEEAYDFAQDSAAVEEAYETETMADMQEPMEEAAMEAAADEGDANDNAVAKVEEAAPLETAPVESAKATGGAALLEPVPDLGSDSVLGSEMVTGFTNNDSGASEYKSARRLSIATKLPVSDIKSLLAKSTETGYRSYENGMAEISYLVDGDTISLRMLPAGREFEYEGVSYTITEIIVEDYSVRFAGDGQNVYAALWNTDEAGYYLSSEMGLSEAEMLKIVSEVIKP